MNGEPRTTISNAIRHATVQRTAELTPGMRRIVFGGAGLEGFGYHPAQMGPYLKLLIPHPGGNMVLGVPSPESGDGNGLPGNAAATLRTYSVRDFNPVSHELTIDFVLHGDEGVASGWAARAKAGDMVGVLERGSRPVGNADRFILAGDHTALPAIAQMLENMAPESRGDAFIEIPHARERQEISNRTQISLTWLLADGGASSLVEHVMRSRPEGRLYVWTGAEAGIARDIRRHVKEVWRLPPENHFIVNYWRRGSSEDSGGKSD